MDLKELSQEMDQLVRSKGWYAENTPRAQTPRNLAISISLEAAEILEHFQWGENSPAPEELPGELADVMLYLLQLARVTGIDLEEAVLNKIQINYKRTWDAPTLETETTRGMA